MNKNERSAGVTETTLRVLFSNHLDVVRVVTLDMHQPHRAVLTFFMLKDLCLRLPHHTVCFRHFSAFSKPCVRQSAFTLAKEVLITDVSLVLGDKFGFFRL